MVDSILMVITCTSCWTVTSLVITSIICTITLSCLPITTIICTITLSCLPITNLSSPISTRKHRCPICFDSLSLKQLTTSKRRKQSWVHALWKGCDGLWTSCKNRICPQRKKSYRLLRSRILNRVHPLSILGQIRRVYPIRESIGKSRLGQIHGIRPIRKCKGKSRIFGSWKITSPPTLSRVGLISLIRLIACLIRLISINSC